MKKARKGPIDVILMIIISVSLIIIIPISSISLTFSSYDNIEDFISYPYEPSSPSPIEHLYIKADVANIDIRFVDAPVDYYALIDVSIVMSGVNLAHKSIEDYIAISWSESTSLANLTFKIISDDWFNSSLWLKKEVNIIVNLRKDIIFDIDATVKKGNVKISVPWGASVNNVEINNVNGNILYDFDNCVIKGNIAGNITEGDFKLQSYNVECTQDVNWMLNNDGGDFNMSLSIS